MGNAGCPRCRNTVALCDGRPFISSTGTIELWHRTCWEERHVPIVVAPRPMPSSIERPTYRARGIVGGIGAAVIAIVLVASTRGDAPAAALVNIDVSGHETVTTRGSHGAREFAPPRVVSRDGHLEIPTIGGVSLDKLYPSLRGWIHPVAATTERVPPQSSRRFGSVRHGIDRTECRAGHCGVDLDGPRGRPIVAVAAGTVVRIERSEAGRDGRSGRYVRIEHDDGTLTAYMHLDHVAARLGVGDRVDAAQYIGTLGMSGIVSAAPHLHFTLEVPARLGLRGDHVRTEYVDAAPFLARARITPVPEHEPKPAS